MDMKAIKKLLMGESGKTISDADRQRVMNMLGKSGAKKKKSIIEKQMDIVMPGQQTMNKGGKVAPKKMMGGGAAKKARKMRGGGGVAPKKMRGGGAAKQVSPRKLMAMGLIK
jgi:hypothetical protein